MPRIRPTLLAPSLLLAALPLSSHAQLATAPLLWPDRSGPTHNQLVPEQAAANLPTTWDEASGLNIAWKVAVEPATNEGHSTPVIGGDLIWLTSASTDGKKQYIHAYNRHDGSTVHHILLFENAEPEELGNPMNNYAAPSCVLEEDAVYVHFGTYGTARLDPLTATPVWQRRDIECRHYRGPGSSPVLFEDLLILTFDGVDQQFVMALDKNTGETVWRTGRTTDYEDLDADGNPSAEGDYRKAYNTPAVAVVGDRTQLISVGARAAFGYDARTGEELWTLRHPDYNAAVRPIVLDGVVYIGTGTKGHLYAVRLDETTLGDITDTHVIWHRERRNATLASPVIANGYLFHVAPPGIGVCVDLATGEEQWEERLGQGQHVASAIATPDHVYFFSQVGNATVVAASPEHTVIATNELQEGMNASPVVAEGALYLRTTGHLYKIAAP